MTDRFAMLKIYINLVAIATITTNLAVMIIGR